MTEITSAPRRRRARFRRDAEFHAQAGKGSGLELTNRDLGLVTAVARHRYLNSAQAVRLFTCACPRVESFGLRAGILTPVLVKQHRPDCSCSCGVGARKRAHAPGCLALFKDAQHVTSRLTALYHAGYLERPVAQLQLRVKDGVITKGSVPMVYAVTTAGLDLIGSERRVALGPGKLSWAAKVNEGSTRTFIAHTLAVSGFSVGIDVAVRGHRRLERLSETDLKARMAETRIGAQRPWGLRVRYRGEELTTVPDLAFAVGDRELRKRWNYLVEIDMGSMPIEREGLARTSIMRKLIGYAKAFEDGLHQTELGWKAFRVLIVTTSEARVASCIAAAKARFGSAAVGRIFLFATHAAAQDPLTCAYRDIDGRPVHLFAE